jgi:hypothetical protein
MACAVWQIISAASRQGRPATWTSQKNVSIPVAARIAIASRGVQVRVAVIQGCQRVLNPGDGTALTASPLLSTSDDNIDSRRYGGKPRVSRLVRR